MEVDLVKVSRTLNVLFTYLRIRLAVVQWAEVGAWRNWQTLFTAKEISGLVSVKYWSAPTKRLYLVPPSWLKGTPFASDNCSELESGVGDGLQPCNPALLTRSVAYFSWERWRPPSWFFLTSMPRKNASHRDLWEQNLTANLSRELWQPH